MSALAFDQMTIDQQIRVVQELWDKIATRPDEVPVTDEQLAELRRRRELQATDPSRAIPLDAARARLRSGD